MSVALYLATLAVGVPVPFLCVPFVCALLNFGITVPSSPGYVGVYQFLIVYLLSIFGVPRSEGFTILIPTRLPGTSRTRSWVFPFP